MSKWIDGQISKAAIAEYVNLTGKARDDYRASLEALKKAEEGLMVAEQALGDKPIARSIVTDAIKTIEDLGNE